MKTAYAPCVQRRSVKQKRKKKMKNKFKTIDNLTKPELISILKEIEKRLFHISVCLNNSAPLIHDAWTDDFKKQCNYSHEKSVKSAYEAWFYLGAIGASLIGTEAEAIECLNSPLGVQRKFLSHKTKKKKQGNNNRG